MGAMKYPGHWVGGRQTASRPPSGAFMRDKSSDPPGGVLSQSSAELRPGACEIGLVGNVLFVVWREVTSAAVRTVVREAQEAAKLLGEPVIYITIIPDGVPAPGEAERRALVEALQTNASICRSMHCVIEGQGFKKTMQRSVAAGIFLLAGKRGKMTVHDSVTEALKSADGLQTSVSSVLHRARQQGLLP